MGNCVTRKQEKESSSNKSGYFMGFRVISVRPDSGFSKILFLCKKRLSRNHESINIESILSPSSNPINFFDYEEPLGVLDDQEVNAFLKSEETKNEEIQENEDLV